jgi:hypothetical protein
MKTTKQRLQELANVKPKKRPLQEHKSNIKVTWKTMEDMEGDLQDWLSELLPNQVQEVLDTLQNFVDNYEGEMDMDDDF